MGQDTPRTFGSDLLVDGPFIQTYSRRSRFTKIVNVRFGKHKMGKTWVSEGPEVPCVRIP